MNSNSLSKQAWSLIVLGLAVVAALGVRTISNSDFWTHLAMGRQIAEHGLQKVDAWTFTASGASWVNGSWLYDRVLFLLWSLGAAPLVILLHAAAAVLAFALLIPATRQWAGGSAISLALVLCAWLLASRFTIAPHVAALPFAAIFIMLFSEPRKPWVPWAVLLPLQVLWANLHTSFVLGPAICAVFAVQFWVSARSGERAAANRCTSAGWLTVATLMAGMVNPYGMASYASGLLSVTNAAFKFVREWISPFSAQFPASFYPKHIVTLALLVGAGGLLAEKRNLPLALTTLAIASAILIILLPWNIEWLALLAFPFFALSLRAIGVLIENGLRSRMKTEKAYATRGAAAGLAALLAILSVVMAFSSAFYVYAGSASVFGLGTEFDPFPHAASNVIARSDFPARAVNLASDGGFLVWEHPDRLIFVDQRASLYGVEFYTELNQCLAGEKDAWKAILEKWSPDAVILNCSVPFAANACRGLLRDSSWALVYFDGTAAILVRATSDHQALIRDAQVQNTGLQLIEEERLLALKTTKHLVSPRLIGAAELFLALGRYREAESVCSALIHGTPMMGRAWINKGIAQMEQGKVQDAVETLRRACEIAPKDVFAWIFLYQAGNRAGYSDEARAAIEKAKKVNPKTTTMFLSSEQRAEPKGRKAPALPVQ